MSLKKGIETWKVSINKEVKSHPTVYILISTILLLAFFVRVYRLDQLLGFYYDQGRDALVIWKLWHEGKPFLIGPVTGLAGIFLGPFYYYLIAPFYLIGGGNPVYPSVFLAFLATLGIFINYFLGKEMYSRIAGLIAAIISSFSYYLVLAGRWLSNPTPILFTSVLLFWAMYRLLKTKNQKLWILISFLVGISLHFESASAIFYIPMILVYAIWLYKKNRNVNENILERMWGNWKILAVSIGVFILTLMPQIAFNFKHENILFNNFRKVLVEEKSFRNPVSAYNLQKKKEYFWSVFTSKIFPGRVETSQIFYVAGLVGLLTIVRKKLKELTLFAVFLGVPMVGYIFFQGNYGNIYDYYMTGYYSPMILLFSIGLGALWKNVIGKIVIFWFLVTFLNLNGTMVKNQIVAGVDGPTHITLGNQLQSVDWVFENAEGRGEFNIDVYVPPVIPYAYDYLFLWQASKRCGKSLCGMMKDKQVTLLYTLFEQDPPHPERLEAWMERQEGIGVVVEEVRFGGVTVQRRMRI